jgi:hypothetical protein
MRLLYITVMPPVNCLFLLCDHNASMVISEGHSFEVKAYMTFSKASRCWVRLKRSWPHTTLPSWSRSLCILDVNATVTPKFPPPPPQRAQKRSRFFSSLSSLETVTSSPSAVMKIILRRLSQPRP